MPGLSFLPSKRLVLSYIVDWIAILLLAGIGAIFNVSTPYMRPFSLVDLSISYPLVKHEVIPTWLLVVASLIAPGIIIFLVCLFLVPGPTVSPATPKSLIWRRKFWEWNTGWMGLGLSLAMAFFLTQGMKNLFGKPRPSMLARCNPDTSVESIQANTVGGGYAAELDPRWVLVSAAICNPLSQADFKDGFRSFPSGHSSMSWSGLLYLAFFLCSKFAISIPFLPPRSFSHDQSHTAAATPTEAGILPLHHNSTHSHDSSKDISDAGNLEDLARSPGDDVSPIVPIRNQAAAPPVYLLLLPLVPISTAIYITASRFFQFYHHGFDVIFGSFIGIASSWFAFRWYHLPVTRGAGWSWGARSRDRAWGVGVGRATYVGTEGWGSKKSDESRAKDGANGSASRNVALGPGLDGQQGEDSRRHNEQVSPV